MAGLVYRGAAGGLLPRLTRAQTVMLLLNSLALELVLLCMFFSGGPSEGTLVINPVKIFAAGSLAACICIPGIFICAALFAPRELLLSVARLLRRLACAPCEALRCCGRVCRGTLLLWSER